MQITRTVADTVRAEMARRRVTQEAVAARLNLSQSAVSRRLKGDVPFDVNELAIIAEIVDRPVSYLVGEEVTAA